MSLPDEVIEILKTTQTIAVVGLSAKPERPSHYVSLYLQHHGYRILPVHPALKHVLGHPCVARLEELRWWVCRPSRNGPAITSASICSTTVIAFCRCIRR